MRAPWTYMRARSVVLAFSEMWHMGIQWDTKGRIEYAGPYSGFVSASGRLQENRIGFLSASFAERGGVAASAWWRPESKGDPDHHSDEPTLSDAANLGD